MNVLLKGTSESGGWILLNKRLKQRHSHFPHTAYIVFSWSKLKHNFQVCACTCAHYKVVFLFCFFNLLKCSQCIYSSIFASDFSQDA